MPHPPEGILSAQDIKDRLHYFNLTRDWTVFNDVPPPQQVSVLYPEVIRSFASNETLPQQLIRMFGHLSPEWQKRYDEWLNNKNTNA